MNTARGIFGAVLAAGALATIATFHHQFWPSVQSPPQPIEATRKADSLARPESVTQEFADLPKSVRTVPVTRQAAPSPTPPAPVQQAIAVAPTPPPPAARDAADSAVPATLPSHAEPVDVCARYGGHRVNFMRGHHAMWRCDYPRHNR
jgi:hypothetical protein